jgi:anti-sigma factor RsiW
VKHLGERVTALVDDQLDDNARDLALAHVARCADCRAAVERERAAKAVLHGLPDVVPNASFMQSLFALAEPGGPIPPQRRPFPDAAPTSASWRDGVGASGTPSTGHSYLRGRTSVRLAVGGVVTVGALTAVLASLGGPEPTNSQPASVVVPPLHQFTVEHARSSAVLPFFEPASVVVPHDSSPDTDR